MLSAEKLALLANYLSKRTRAFHEVQNEFRQSFFVEEYAVVTSLIARFLSSIPFEGAILGAEEAVAEPEAGASDAEPSTLEQGRKRKHGHAYFAIEHAYAAVILSVADSERLISGTELAKIEQTLKERLIKYASHDEPVQSDPMYHPLHYLKLVWLCGSHIPHGLLSFSGNEYFALPPERLEPYFTALRTDSTQRTVTAHPMVQPEPILGVHCKENGFLSHSSLLQMLVQAQADMANCMPYPTVPLSVPSLSTVTTALDALFQGNTDAADAAVRATFNESSDYLTCMHLLHVAAMKALTAQQTDFILRFILGAPDRASLLGITPQDVRAFLESGNTRLAGAVLRVFAYTTSLSCFLEALIEAENHSENVYSVLRELMTDGLLSSQYLARFLRAGFAAYGTESVCPTDFTPANELFCGFCTAVLTAGVLDAREIHADVCRYCSLHQCIPKVVKLFVTLQNCATVV